MIKNLIKELLLERGYFLTTAVPQPQVESILRRLRPNTTDKPLLRIGGESDGGYLVPDDLDGIRYCFSPGVSVTSTFESAMAERGIFSFLADYSVEAPPVASPMFHFEKRFLGAANNEIFMTLEHWVDKSIGQAPGDLLLQMDIEGSEYDVIVATPQEVWRRFRILVVEFHDLNAMFQTMGMRLISLCFEKLLENFEVVHLHPNNCCGSAKRGEIEIPHALEFTFLRKDRIGTSAPAKSFPHPLDKPNIPGKKDLTLPGCWYRD